jgi:hypothetical protein
MATITAAARTMYPHDALPDDVYARVGGKLAEAAREDSGAAQTIEEGVSALNGSRPFAEPRGRRAARGASGHRGLWTSSSSCARPRSSRSTRPAHVAAVGYEGPSFDKGGYIDRGFNDLDWLPDPEAEA